MAQIFVEPTRAAEFIVSEANGARSRDVVAVAANLDLPAGAVLGFAPAQPDAVPPVAAGDVGAFVAGDTAVGIAFGPVVTGAEGGTAVVIARDAEVIGALVNVATADRVEAVAGLADLGIIVR